MVGGTELLNDVTIDPVILIYGFSIMFFMEISGPLSEITINRSETDIIGHFDIIKKNNLSGNYFSENDDWYKQEMRDTLIEVARSGCIVEASTAGMARGCTNDLYPSMWILRECQDLYIPIILNSDAHTPKELDAYFEVAVKRLNAVGYFEQSVLLGGTWKQVELQQW